MRGGRGGFPWSLVFLWGLCWWVENVLETSKQEKSGIMDVSYKMCIPRRPRLSLLLPQKCEALHDGLCLFPVAPFILIMIFLVHIGTSIYQGHPCESPHLTAHSTFFGDRYCWLFSIGKETEFGRDSATCLELCKCGIGIEAIWWESWYFSSLWYPTLGSSLMLLLKKNQQQKHFRKFWASLSRPGAQIYGSRSLWGCVTGKHRCGPFSVGSKD